MQTFAYVVETKNNQPISVYTNNNIMTPTSKVNYPDSTNGQKDPWISIIQKSNTPCPN